MTGDQCSINGELMNIKFYIQVCCMDSVPTTTVQVFVQFNKCYECNQCIQSRELVRNKITYVGVQEKKFVLGVKKSLSKNNFS